MFNPSQHDVRRFFCETYRKQRANEILTPIEAIARDWIIQHPEYADDLADIEAALAADYSVENGQTNPFLHLAMPCQLPNKYRSINLQGFELHQPRWHSACNRNTMPITTSWNAWAR